jgi:membrane-associated phospholipid phosphatase
LISNSQKNGSVWLPLLKSPKFRIQFFSTLLALIVTLFSYRRFLDFAEARPGVIIPDPILKLYNPIDLTWLIFGLIYLCLIIGIFALGKKPEKLLLAFQTYTALVIVRIIAMYLMPFEAPEKLIVLKDPFVEMFGSGNSLTKDLFFSGHTATLFLLFLVVESKKLKYIFLGSAVVVGIAIVIQHVHYVIDVFASPFFAYVCFSAVASLNLYRIKL